MTTKTVFQIAASGMFIGATVADESPLEPGHYLMPAGTVEIAPPDTWPDDKWPRWNGVAWDLVTRPVPQSTPDSPIDKVFALLCAKPEVIDKVLALLSTDSGTLDAVAGKPAASQ